MIEILQKNPDKDFCFNDDNEAKMILFELGIGGRFSQKPPNVPKGEQSQQVVKFTEHPTHYVLAILYAGSLNKDENGYVVFCIPKSKHTPETLDKIIAEVLNPRPERIAVRQGFHGDSPDN